MNNKKRKTVGEWKEISYERFYPRGTFTFFKAETKCFSPPFVSFGRHMIVIDTNTWIGQSVCYWSRKFVGPLFARNDPTLELRNIFP
jgi:hypothetical protein